jgi:hypothetical protein
MRPMARMREYCCFWGSAGSRLSYSTPQQQQLLVQPLFPP